MKIGNRNFDDGKTYVMGILNVTPDSFSDGGKWNALDSAVVHTEKMIEDGASIIDVGGESTRPGYTKISDEEEIRRVVPIISEIKKRFDIPVSVDTYKASVAEAAIKAGADLVNDIWGLKYDGNMAPLIAKYGSACCIMHNKVRPQYNNITDDIINETLKSVDIAINAGIEKNKIIIDPGVGLGFGKTYKMNLSVLKHLNEFCAVGYPVLLGCSRKSVIGNALDLPVEQRVEGTLVTTVLAVMSRCLFVRVHDVKENVRAVKMTEAILRGE